MNSRKTISCNLHPLSCNTSFHGDPLKRHYIQRSVFRALSNIWDGTFWENSLLLKGTIFKLLNSQNASFSMFDRILNTSLIFTQFSRKWIDKCWKVWPLLWHYTKNEETLNGKLHFLYSVNCWILTVKSSSHDSEFHKSSQ